MFARFDTAIPFALTVLLNALWQPAAIAGGVWLILRVLRNTNATTRHALWSWALVASFLFPILTALAVSAQRNVVPPATSVQTNVTTATSVPNTGPVNIKVVTTIERSAAAAKAIPSFSIQRPHFSLPKIAALITIYVWLLAALIIVGRLLVSVLHLERLKRDSLPLPVEARERLDRWPSAPSNGRDVRVCVSPTIAVPVAIGLFDSMILLPNDLTQELDGADLDRVLLHELAHLRRCDDWVNLFERIVEALYFFSPGIHWIAAQMDLEREVACDDWVLQQTQASLPYAQCLARIVERTAWPHRPVAAPGVFNTRRNMSVRIERLLARKRDARVRIAAAPAIAGAGATIAFALASGMISPTIAYAVDSPQTIKPPSAAPAPKKMVKLLVPLHLAQATTPKAPLAPKSTPCPKPMVHSAFAPPAPHMHAHVHVPEPPAVHDAPHMAPPADPGYLDELQAAGYTNLSADEVIKMRATGVDARYIGDLAAAGFPHLSPDQLAEMHSVGVSGQYMAELAKAGLSHLSAREALEMRATGVDGSYVQQLRSAGLNDISARSLSEMRALNVTGDYIRELADHGYPNLPARRYAELRALGVDGAYLEKLRDHGFNGLDVRKVIQMKAEGLPE